MTMNDLTCDKKADAKSRECLFTLALNTIETLEYPLVILFVYSNTMILHANAGKFLISLHKDLDAISIRRIFYCVSQKIHNYLCDAILVRKYFPFKFIVNNNRVF